ncbi:related to FMO1-flavin-containing monooxygenase [Sporisorium reilianum f. sp. reilianum]|uniref:Related to FMO1-flavin-containing monooxygenase n=1 Tax=Sporisorium reilianum f. sp. reilianum TaxID=72559 RepID=A0A2N8U6J4_9BASI|nr:related to FMO1-flavin-containing monooxygenase [Sporisorium reilianum f. sp. reilianum]
MAPLKRVAVIGAGPAGLSAVDQLAALCAPSVSLTLFERRSTFGGVWCYDARPGECVVRYDSSGRAWPLWTGGRKDGDDAGRFRVPGAMYDGLRTNLPCDVMAYRSHPFEGGTALFPDRATVEGYIQNFAEKVVQRAEGVDVRLGTAVRDVRRTAHDPAAARESIGAGSVWSVTSVNVDSGETKVESFDHVVLASGRCNTPTIPRIPGLHKFKGQILHSAWYRSPIPFEHKTVLVVGNSSSGSDIARELSGYILRTLPEGEAATKAFIKRCEGRTGRVLHSYEHFDKPPPLDFDPREEASPDWAKRIAVVPRITEVRADGSVVFEGGETREDVDVLIFGTGYAYDFPYLDQGLAPFVERPLIPLPPPSPTTHDDLGGMQPYTPPHRTAPLLTNLDDFSLFYAPDASICVLGAPIRIVPMPLTHVQSRIVAAAWSGHLRPAPNSTALPRLDASIPTTDPAKWTSRAATATAEDEGSKTSDLGYPSDSAYQDALLDLLPADLSPKGDDEATTVPDQEGGKSEAPVPAQDEGWSRMPDFRNQRRQDTKRLRRLLLGY